MGKSEHTLGHILQDLELENKEAYNRSKYHLSTKVGRYGLNTFDFSAKKVNESLNQSLEILQCDHIDMVFVHDIEFAEHLEQVWQETLPFLFELKSNKHKPIVRHIGVSGMPLSVLDHVMSRFGYQHIDTVLTYNSHILFNNQLLNYLPRWKKHNIGIIHGGTTGLGLLTPQGPPEWHPANHLPIFREACEEAMKYVTKRKGVGNDHNWELIRLAFLYCFDTDFIHSTLVGATNEQEFLRYVDWSAMPVHKEDKDLILWLQHNVFAPVMNRMWVNPGTEKNICNSHLHFYK
ncbi:hypothetical protein RFI_30331 [Reticulomyxa filosa]|uniref:NADP-dependent oxidoreductase domain-containing protein n=1 Tax=Reticulomyxa filosa TaxID=46433 RepID=X6M0C8_RETFI|nr:hypothetical protein RFI_30331 [Reticulomyxa filosa]|eukprot:ETO07061.1 hypothetical protein RFI_30331 [Reticulomyxa filosa]